MPVEFQKDGKTYASITGAAVDGYRVQVLRSSLKLYAETGIRTHRGFNLTSLLAMASELTGKPYGKSKKGASKAVDDLMQKLQEAGDLDTMGADAREARQRKLASKEG